MDRVRSGFNMDLGARSLELGFRHKSELGKKKINK